MHISSFSGVGFWGIPVVYHHLPLAVPFKLMLYLYMLYYSNTIVVHYSVVRIDQMPDTNNIDFPLEVGSLECMGPRVLITDHRTGPPFHTSTAASISQSKSICNGDPINWGISR